MLTKLQNKGFLALLVMVSIFPIVSFAQQDAGGLIGVIADLINLLIPVLMGLGLLVLLWGVVQFIFSAGDEEKRKKGQSKIVAGVIGLFVMVAIWGLVTFVIDTTDIGTDKAPDPPGIPGV